MLRDDLPSLNLRLIGQMEAWSSTNENLLPPGRKTRALLAVLALSGPTPVLRSHIAGLLWSRRGESDARASLRQQLLKLLVALAPAKAEIVLVTRDHLTLNFDVVRTDIDDVIKATTDQNGTLSLPERDLLECMDGIDPGFDTWLRDKRQALRDRTLSAAEASLHEQAESDTTILAAKRLLRIDRAHEGAWRALMAAYAKKGERGFALQAYDQCRAILASRFDAAPSDETQQLLIAIRGPAGNPH
jgi:DNA-binding SARP family transcriptional activator